MNLANEQIRLSKMTAKELRTEYPQRFGESIPGNKKTWIIRRMLWRLQAQAEGGLGERDKRLVAELADDSQLRVTATERDRYGAHRAKPRSPTASGRYGADPPLQGVWKYSTLERGQRPADFAGIGCQ